MGVFPFNAGSSGSLYLGDNTGEADSTKQIGFDTVMFVLDGAYNCQNGVPALPGDADLDRVEDGLDNCPTTYNPGQENTDGDGQGDACDADDDNDGFSDGTEGAYGSNPLVAASTPEGPAADAALSRNTCDGLDNDLDAVVDEGFTNTDGDSQADCADPDDDNDTVLDPFDNCQFVSNVGQEDNDLDAIGDVCDPDDDNDAVIDPNDNCQFLSNVGQENNDGDALGDVCDPDDDNDTIDDPLDNCQFAANTQQENTDAGNPGQNRPGADTIGDACDDDADGDGYTAVREVVIVPAKDDLLYCAIMRADVDDDGVVSILDLSRDAMRFGQTIPPAPDRLNQDADGVISILDLSRQAMEFGKPVTMCP